MSRDFLSIATGQSLLTPELAENLSREAANVGESVETIVARRGLLSAVQMDIVQTLRRPDEVVPGYELLDVIGQGGMGVVYRAWQTTLDRVVAIKTILVSQVSDQQMATRFAQEARAVARLKHPNIINAIDFGEHNGRLYFVMELVEGQDLQTWIEQQRMRGVAGIATEKLAWGLARQAASGLAHAAEQGIVHRDIKPANLLLVEPPAGFPLPVGLPLVKIADFGLAFLANEAETKTRLTAANTTVGTPHYLAPEQLDGKPVDARADIYALGATLFHLLAGQPPFAGLALTQILTQKLTADVPRLKQFRADISAETDSLIAAMMARQPEQRLPSYSQLLSRIDDLWSKLNTVTQTEMPALQPTMILSMSDDPPELAKVAQRNTSAAETKALDNDRATPEPLPLTSRISLKPGGRWSRRRVIGAGVSTVVLAGVSWWGMQSLLRSNRSPLPAEPRLVPSGWSEPLFDGRSLKSWKMRSGAWQMAQDDEGAGVLSGTNGVAACSLIRGELKEPRFLEHFRLTLAARLHQARALEVHFGILRTADGDGVRLAIRLERDKAWVVRRSSDRGPSQPITTPIPLADGADPPRVLRLVRDATHWFVSVDDQSLGTLSLSGQSELPEFRLLAEAGPVWVSDIEVEELRAQQESLK